ncbi:unnamed protein product, partial [Rotaria magnacalcarata]
QKKVDRKRPELIKVIHQINNSNVGSRNQCLQTSTNSRVVIKKRKKGRENFKKLTTATTTATATT